MIDPPCIKTIAHRYSHERDKWHETKIPRIPAHAVAVAHQWPGLAQRTEQRALDHCRRAVQGKHLLLAEPHGPEQPLDTVPARYVPGHCKDSSAPAPSL